jgi:hypothetical protein
MHGAYQPLELYIATTDTVSVNQTGLTLAALVTFRVMGPRTHHVGEILEDRHHRNVQVGQAGGSRAGQSAAI